MNKSPSQGRKNGEIVSEEDQWAGREEGIRFKYVFKVEQNTPNPGRRCNLLRRAR
jgi:hypothetical protein